jgi:hypothetical protein
MLTLDETGRFVGASAWVELRLFEVVGGWAPSVPEPEVAAHLAAQSRRHAGHAELWLAHRPVVAGRDPDDLVVPPSAGTEKALQVLADLGPSGRAVGGDPGADADGPSVTVERLAGLVRVVVPRLLVGFRRRLDEVSVVADGALRRTLRLVLADLAEDGAEGERLLQSVLVTEADVARAASLQSRLEPLLLDPG